MADKFVKLNLQCNIIPLADGDCAYEYPGGYDERIFALRCGGHLVAERVSPDELSKMMEGFYEPEFDDFSVQYWGGCQWIAIDKQ